MMEWAQPHKNHVGVCIFLVPGCPVTKKRKEVSTVVWCGRGIGVSKSEVTTKFSE